MAKEKRHVIEHKKIKNTKNITKGDRFMKISYIKSSKDKKSFKLFKNLGMDVHEIDDLESIDSKINELIQKQATTIIITSELANCSENIFKKYKNQEMPNIIIVPSRNV